MFALADKSERRWSESESKRGCDGSKQSECRNALGSLRESPKGAVEVSRVAMEVQSRVSVRATPKP